MANTIRKIFAMLLAICLCVGMAPQAIAAATTETETTVDGELTTTVTTTTETTVNGDTTSVEITIETEKDGTNEDGDKVEYDELREEKNEYTGYQEGVLVDKEWETDGKEIINSDKAPEVTVDIPLTDKDDPETEETENQATATDGPASGTVETTDNLPEGEDNGANSDNTTTTTTQQGKVTVTTNKITVTETVEENALEHVFADETPDADNDLLKDNTGNTGAVLPVDPENPPVPKDGYDFVYIGSGNSTQFWVAYVMAYEEDEVQPAGKTPIHSYVNDEGKTVYLYAGSKGQKVDSLYVDGEEVKLENPVNINRSGTFQFVMYNSETGKTSTTYCADLFTGALKGYSYNIENLDDATYFGKEQADMIRTVAKNGYWGVVDDPETEEAEAGSLEAIKKMMRGAKEGDKDVFTEEEIATLTDGVALAATQYAVWTFSNDKDHIQIINSMYSKCNDQFVLNSYWNSVPAEEKAKLNLLFKLYDYIINLPGTGIEGTTADTIINENNFLKDASITVVEKAKDHENNKDNDDTNDAYVTDIRFALVVKPSTENGDDLVVQIIGKNGEKEEIIATGRIAGEPQEGETLLVPDENGNYTFSGITLVEGNHNINISLSGVQNLEEGVYLYTSEYRGNTKSQTMVGLASGERDVNVKMNLKFEVDVDDKVVVRERVWHYEGESTEFVEYPPEEDPPEETPPSNDPPTPYNEPPTEEPPAPPTEYDPPTEEIPDEPVPLANVPGLGDESNMWLMIAAFAFIGFVALNLPEKKREED